MLVMKNISEISKCKRIAVFILSLMISLMGVFSSEGLPIENYEDHVTSKSEQELPDSHRSDSETSPTIKRTAIPSSAHLTVIYQPLLLMNITYDEDDTGKIEGEQNVQHDEFFKRLFKRVISPNAP